MLMKAMVIDVFGGAEKLHLKEIPVPQPKENEVLIRIAYAAVNPVDWKICEGMLKNMLPHEFPLVPGWDAAGVIESVGEDVTGFKVDDEVFAYCRKPIVHEGTYAEYITFEAKHIAHKPKNITLAQAAAVPLVALTAWQALIDEAQLQTGESVLIEAGAGGVGGFGIQLAKYLGAKVYTTASKENHAYVKQLGADFVIDYQHENVQEKIKAWEPKGLDVVFDCVGGETLKSCYSLLKPGGRLVSIAGQIDPKLTEKYKIFGSFCFVTPNGAQLAKIGKLIEEGKLKIPQIEEFPIEQAAVAWAKSQQGHTHGKIVLKVHYTAGR